MNSFDYPKHLQILCRSIENGNLTALLDNIFCYHVRYDNDDVEYIKIALRRRQDKIAKQTAFIFSALDAIGLNLDNFSDSYDDIDCPL